MAFRYQHLVAAAGNNYIYVERDRWYFHVSGPHYVEESNDIGITYFGGGGGGKC